MNFKQLTKKFSRVPQFVTGLTLLAFVTLVFIGMFDCSNPIMQSQMDMKSSQHQMDGCPPGNNCGMDINQHLSIWQKMFTTTFNTDLLNLFVVLFVIAFVAGFYGLLSSPGTSSRVARYVYYERNHRENKLYNYLINIFRTGILQPKIFA